MISRVAKRNVTYIPISQEEARENLQNDPQWLIDSKIDIWKKNVQGWTAVLSPDVEQILARPPKSFNEFAAENAYFWE